MAMVLYPAIIEKAKDGFGVWFPDIDGCVTGGDTIEEATAMAAEVLSFWFEDAQDVPPASSYEAAKKRARSGDIVMLVPARIAERLERVNISITDATRAMGDALAAEEGTSRSGLVTRLIHERYYGHATAPGAGKKPAGKNAGFGEEKPRPYKAPTADTSAPLRTRKRRLRLD